VKVALVTHQFFPEFYTGVERLTLNLAMQLARMGHEAVVVTSSDEKSSYTVSGVSVRPIATLRANLAEPWLGGAGAAMRSVLEEEDVDLVHVMHPMRLPIAFDDAARLGLPVVAHVADFYYACPRITMLRVDGSLCMGSDGGRACAQACGIPSGPPRLRWALDLLAAAAAVISPCRFTVDVHAAEGFNTGDWRHIPWGVDYQLHRDRLPQPDNERLKIGFLGTLLAHKGPKVLVEAMQQLAGRDIELVLYGGSFHEPAYEREVRALASGDDRIRFAGSYVHEDLPAVLAELDAVAIPSLWHENLPTSGLNAIASGVPLLVSDVGGLEELIQDYECGFSFRAGDASSLAALLDGLAADRSLLENVRSRMKSPPSVEEEAWRIEGVYEDVLAGRSAASPAARRRLTRRPKPGTMASVNP
jgi:glycosyltransferase involved in cell wall biosynthesis